MSSIVLLQTTQFLKIYYSQHTSKSQLNSLVYHLQLYHCIMNIFIIYLLIYSYSLKAKEKKHIIILQGVI